MTTVFCDSCDIVHACRLRHISPSPATISALSPLASRRSAVSFSACTLACLYRAPSLLKTLEPGLSPCCVATRITPISSRTLQYTQPISLPTPPHPLGTCSAVHHHLSSNHRKIPHLCVSIASALSRDCQPEPDCWLAALMLRPAASVPHCAVEHVSSCAIHYGYAYTRCGVRRPSDSDRCIAVAPRTSTGRSSKQPRIDVHLCPDHRDRPLSDAHFPTPRRRSRSLVPSLLCSLTRARTLSRVATSHCPSVVGLGGFSLTSSPSAPPLPHLPSLGGPHHWPIFLRRARYRAFLIRRRYCTPSEPRTPSWCGPGAPECGWWPGRQIRIRQADVSRSPGQAGLDSGDGSCVLHCTMIRLANSDDNRMRGRTRGAVRDWYVSRRVATRDGDCS